MKIINNKDEWKDVEWSDPRWNSDGNELINGKKPRVIKLSLIHISEPTRPY